jgi:hypothetical protein
MVRVGVRDEGTRLTFLRVKPPADLRQVDSSVLAHLPGHESKQAERLIEVKGRCRRS